MDILNACMETMVEQYHAELLPVAAELTARLVCIRPFLLMAITLTSYSVTPTRDSRGTLQLLSRHRIERWISMLSWRATPVRTRRLLQWVLRRRLAPYVYFRMPRLQLLNKRADRRLGGFVS